MNTMLKPADNVPRYRELLKPLRDQIISGQLKPGDQLPSLVEMRARHNVSRGTVEKVHSLLEAEGLIVREQGRGVFVTGSARPKRHGVIAFSALEIFEQQRSDYGAQLSSGIGSAASEENFQLLLVDGKVDTPVLEKVDGLIVYVGPETMGEIMTRVPPGLPCVSVMMPQPELDCVLADDYRGMYEATRHLTDLGHRRIAYLLRSYDNMMERRLAGYSDALQAVGVEPKLAWVKRIQMALAEKDSSQAFRQHGQRTMEQWLATDWKNLGCTALLAQNDHCAVGAIAALQKAGYRVPEDVSVVGFDGTETYEWFSPSLTTVHVPLYEIGKSAVKLLISRMQKGERGHEHQQKESTLRIGQSTGPCPKS